MGSVYAVLNIPGYCLQGRLRPWTALEPSMLSQAAAEPQPTPPPPPETKTATIKLKDGSNVCVCLNCGTALV